jgi:16S rRNA (adenine1518-N6/adenine1519-N6)-dimethyltransferase
MKHVARKRFGQHFLSDAYVLGAIVELIDPQPGQALVEIGPGLGALTWPLLQRCASMTAIELDRDLAARLRRHGDGLTVIEADVLTVDFAALAQQMGQSLRLVGNLPYNISTPILFHLLGAAAHVADQHFMLQKAFEPPPKVDSAVVRMRPLPQASAPPQLLAELVTVAFSQRRKLLRHTLGRWLDERGFGGAFDLQRRAEEVPVAQYLALAEAVAAR